MSSKRGVKTCKEHVGDFLKKVPDTPKNFVNVKNFVFYKEQLNR